MALYGFLCCATCKEVIFLGKWLHEGDRGVGFWHEQLCPERLSDAPTLGRKALRFIARHMDHDLIAASEGGRADAIIEAGEYRDVDGEYDGLAQKADG
jgi:hypothetical protein